MKPVIPIPQPTERGENAGSLLPELIGRQDLGYAVSDIGTTEDEKPPQTAKSALLCAPRYLQITG